MEYIGNLVRQRFTPHSPGSAELIMDEDDLEPLPELDSEDHDDLDIGTDFFASGRDFESTYVNHKYTEKEQELLASYESLDYLPPDSQVYRKWLRNQPNYSSDWDRWIVMGLIGFLVGIVGFLLHQLIDLISSTKWQVARELVTENLFLGWLWVFGYSLIFLLISTTLVVLFRPSAAGSGMPELIGFLNGALVRHVFNIKTLFVKFFSCALVVASGLPVGPEGPMIHMGALIGAGVSQLQSRTLGFSVPYFNRLRNSQDKRNFISAGAAAGIASAFGAPVGGLLFAMEEVSSYWSMKLSWQTFFCCMVSAFTTDLLDSAFYAFRYEGLFGQFKTDRYILFNIKSGIDVNILAIIPCLILGCVGGILGSAYVFLNLKIAKLRRKIHSTLKSKTVSNLLKMAEPIIILLLTSLFIIAVSGVYGCTPMSCIISPKEDSLICSNVSTTESVGNIESNVEYFNCPYRKFDLGNGSTFANGSFNQAATLLFVTGEETIHHLLSRNTHLQFDYLPLFIMLIFYYIMSCWTSGTYISSGLVVPMLLIGALYGRIFGKFLVDIFGISLDSYWDWIDPGALSLIGAVSFFGGVTRLTLALTVIMVEMTNDIQFLLLIMVTVMVAKWVGDFVTHPIYHAQIELKCIPFLEQEPVVVDPLQKSKANLELFNAKDVMATPVKTIYETTSSIAKLARLLSQCKHGGFPVVNENQEFIGTLSRMELVHLLLKYHDSNGDTRIFQPEVSYDEMTCFMQRKLEGLQQVDQKLYELENVSDEILIDLSAYVNKSAVSVRETFSLQRTYVLFRTLGLRHLIAVDHNNHVKGIITRKDLMGFSIEKKIIRRIRGEQDEF